MTGIDFKLQKLVTGFYDIDVNLDGDFVSEDAFDTSILVSLFTDARANSSEVAESHRRRGWAGNLLTPGIEMGGKIWLWFQSRLQDRDAEGLDDAVNDSMAWFKDDGWTEVAPKAISTITGRDAAKTELVITRPDSVIEKRFFDLWNNTGGTLGS